MYAAFPHLLRAQVTHGISLHVVNDKKKPRALCPPRAAHAVQAV